MQHLSIGAEFCYRLCMVSLELEQAQRDLPLLAEKALHGEDVFIAVGSQTLRLSRASEQAAGETLGPRGGRGAWRGRVTVADAFYEPWTDEEMGETEA
nr:hypothetical protein [uncultured Rhodopila sp.]